MVWIHGGGFVTGQGMMFDGSELALRGDVIVVTINYRLNVFGFFTTGDSVARGNFGIWDQRLGIKWVKDNIDDYGGDGAQMTIFGESAGGTSSSLHSISPLNYGLFQRVIIQSGTIVGPLDNGTKATETSRLIALYVNCSSSSSAQVISCLQFIEKENLLRAFSRATGEISRRYFSPKYPLGPIQDDELLPFNPRNIIMNANNDHMLRMFKSIDIMIGTNSAEGGLLKFKLNPCKKFSDFDVTKGIPYDVVCKCMIPAIVSDIFGQKCQGAVSSMCKVYSSDQNQLLSSWTSQAVNLYNDAVYFSTTKAMLQTHAKLSAKTSYHYLFSHRPNWGLIQDRATWLIGANHADELVFVFGLKAWYPQNVPITPEEALLSHRMIDYWTNFAKYGNPNQKGLPNWPAFTPENEFYVDLNENVIENSSFFTKRMNFWLKDLPHLESECKDKSGSNSNYLLMSKSILLGLIITVKQIQ